VFFESRNFGDRRNCRIKIVPDTYSSVFYKFGGISRFGEWWTEFAGIPCWVIVNMLVLDKEVIKDGWK